MPDPSFAFAVTSVLSATLSAGIVIFPDVGSTVTPFGAFSGSFHFPSSPFVAVTVTGSVAPCGVYVTETSFVSASVGGVTVTLPSSFAFTVGAAGAVVSFDFPVASGDSCVPAFSFAFTSSFLDSLLAGIVTIPVSFSIFIDGSVPSASFHSPFSFFAVTFVGLVASPNDISSVSDSLLFGITFTLPSATGSTVGALSFSITVSSCESSPTFCLSPVPCVTVTAPSSETTMLASDGKSVLTFLTASLTFSFSSAVN